MITRSCPWCKALLKKLTWLQPWKCERCGWELTICQPTGERTCVI